MNDKLRDSLDMYLDTMDLALARPIAFLPVFSRLTGSVTAGLMLSQLRYWTTKKGRNEWIYKTQEEMEQETTLTRREQETARRRLMQLKIIKVERRGVPARLFYQIDFAVLVHHIESFANQLADFPPSSLAESANLDCTKTPNLNGGNRQTNTEITPETTSETTSGRSSPTDLGQLTLTAPETPQIPEPEPDDRLTPEDLVESWNEFCPKRGLAKVRDLTGTRRKKTLLRLREHPEVQFWSDVLTGIDRSPFLLGLKANGNGHENWRLTFDFLIDNDTNAVRIVEGRYAEVKSAPRR